MLYAPNEELKRLAREVIDENLADFQSVNIIFDQIVFQYADGSKKQQGKIVYADTEKVKAKYSGFVPYLFVVTFYEESCEGFEEKILKRIMYHELLHIGVDSELNTWIVPHDLEDFKVCINKWGTDWVWD